ncbi:hypothetical protein Mic1_56 [Microcystis phage Mic1]|nr:hypothetical protein Mic1_56 [Microcystis phage Mic1]
MTERKEYTGILKINLEVTLPAKSKKEALELLENIYPTISLSFGENIPELLDWRDDIDTADWELED